MLLLLALATITQLTPCAVSPTSTSSTASSEIIERSVTPEIIEKSRRTAAADDARSEFTSEALELAIVEKEDLLTARNSGQITKDEYSKLLFIYSKLIALIAQVRTEMAKTHRDTDNFASYLIKAVAVKRAILLLQSFDSARERADLISAENQLAFAAWSLAHKDA